MALDATVGGAAANSYLTRAQATAYADEDLGPEAERWKSPTTEGAEQDVALIRATREIDRYVRLSFGRYASTQHLKFPRTVDVDANGSTYIPTAIQEATYYQAAFLLVNAGAIDRANARHARDAQQATEPGISYTMADDPSAGMSQRALQALADYAKASRNAASGMSDGRVASGFAR